MTVMSRVMVFCCARMTSPKASSHRALSFGCLLRMVLKARTTCRLMARAMDARSAGLSRASNPIMSRSFFTSSCGTCGTSSWKTRRPIVVRQKSRWTYWALATLYSWWTWQKLPNTICMRWSSRATMVRASSLSLSVTFSPSSSFSCGSLLMTWQR